MLTVEEIENAEIKLPPKDLQAFRNWFAAFDADEWDAKIEADVAAGTFDRLASEALTDMKAGRCTER